MKKRTLRITGAAVALTIAGAIVAGPAMAADPVGVCAPGWDLEQGLVVRPGDVVLGDMVDYNGDGWLCTIRFRFQVPWVIVLDNGGAVTVR